MTKIYDVFPYNGERILELRLKLLYEKVDVFVIGESPINFRGEEKPLKFEIQKFEWAKNKIRYVEFKKSDFDECKSNWDRERKTRNLLINGLYDANDDDLIFLSDCDEIPDPYKIVPAEDDVLHLYEFLHMRYYGNYACLSSPIWKKFISFKKKILNQNDLYSLYLAHLAKPKASGLFLGEDNKLTIKIVPLSGWHFSYLGGATEIAKKLSDFGKDFISIDMSEHMHNIEGIENSIKFGFDGLGFPWYWGKVNDYHLGNKIVEQWFKENDLNAPETFQSKMNIIPKYWKMKQITPDWKWKLHTYRYRLHRFFVRKFINIAP